MNWITKKTNGDTSWLNFLTPRIPRIATRQSICLDGTRDIPGSRESWTNCKSYTKLKIGHYSESFDSLFYVLGYAIDMFPRTRLLMVETLKRLDEMPDNDGGSQGYVVSDDLRHGHVMFFYNES